MSNVVELGMLSLASYDPVIEWWMAATDANGSVSVGQLSAKDQLGANEEAAETAEAGDFTTIAILPVSLPREYMTSENGSVSRHAIASAVRTYFIISTKQSGEAVTA